MESLQPVVSFVTGFLALVVFSASVLIPIVAAWSLANGRRINWDSLIMVAIVLIVLPTVVASYGYWLLSSVNEAFEKSKPEMQMLFVNAQSLFNEDWIIETPKPIPVITVSNPVSATITVVDLLPTPTPSPVLVVPLATPELAPTIFVCRDVGDIALGCLPPTPQVTPRNN